MAGISGALKTNPIIN